MGRGKEEREGDETQEFEDEERRGETLKERLEERNSFLLIYLFTFLPLPSSHLIGWIGISRLYDHIMRCSIKLSRILHWTIKHPGIGISER